MRVMIFALSTPESENAPRRHEGFEEMQRFSQELIDAGILLAGDALQPSANGARVRFKGRKQTVVDGPFIEAKELVAGYWLWQVRSLDEAIEWIKRAPFPDGHEVELRPLYEQDDAVEATATTAREAR